MSRGIRLQNPGNIRISGAPWLGKLTPSNDPEFESFDNPQHGIRALAKILLAYQINHGLDTIRQIISRWAPPGDNNDTQAYITAVSGQTVTAPDTPLNLRNADTLAGLCEAIIHQENGACPYPAALVDAGVALALASLPQPAIS